MHKHIRYTIREMFVRKLSFASILKYCGLALVVVCVLLLPKPAHAAPFICTSSLYQEVSGQLRVLNPSNNTFTTIGPNH